MLTILKNLRLFAVNFSKPWWYLFVEKKWYFGAVLTFVSIAQIFWSLIPFIAAQLFEASSFYLCIVVFIIVLVMDFFLAFMRGRLNSSFQLQCIHSIYKSAHSYLLSVDPQYHVHRSSGAVIAKIERAARGWENFADHMTFEVTPLFIGLVTVIITLGYYSFILAGMMALFIGIILGIGYYFAIYRCQLWEKEFIASDDSFKATALDNLLQVFLIRSTFASQFRSKLLNDDIAHNAETEYNLWLSYINLFMLLSLLYIFSLFTLAMLLIWQIKFAGMTAATALGLFLVYTNSSKEIVGFGRLLRKIIHSKTAIQDLFNFISLFGKQTFPVLGDAESLPILHDGYTIKMQHVHFNYGKARLFNDHSLSIAGNARGLKLYGIIGHSGSGKTTLLSMLGGQMPPVSGHIYINDIDIYMVNDAVRSQLIALQGQIASTIRGTVKSNLLLGLPDNHGYTDQDLTTLLEQVGLLTILNQHNGLGTVLGEGGLSLSGGQRQRLNFAGLFLRATFYKPAVVLIDEPTSSLDEISESAITKMIEVLAENSITFVVAHRLKTIEQAIGIIDLSLLHEDKVVRVYTRPELLNHSEYYKELISGKVQIDG